MPTATALLRLFALGALAISYVVLAHYTLITPGQEKLGALVAITPLLLAAASLAWNTAYRYPVLVLLFAMLIGSANWQAIIGLHFSWLYWIEHAGTQLLLCLMFARSLRQGHEPLCTYLARIVHGSLTPALSRYTRQVTIAWALFFAVMALASTLIFLAAPVQHWSIFANFFTAPLTCGMFIAEYAIRRTKNLGTEQVSILAAVKAFWTAPKVAEKP